MVRLLFADSHRWRSLSPLRLAGEPENENKVGTYAGESLSALLVPTESTKHDDACTLGTYFNKATKSQIS